MSWNYMQPNAGLLNHVGAGYNALGKGLLNMGQFVNDIPMNQKKLGLLDAQTWETNNRAGLLGAQTQAQNIENQHLPNSIMAKNNHLNAQTAHLGAQTQGKQIENQYLPKSIMANINHTNSQTNLNNTRNQAATHGLNQQIYYNKLKEVMNPQNFLTLQEIEASQDPNRAMAILDKKARELMGNLYLDSSMENQILERLQALKQRQQAQQQGQQAIGQKPGLLNQPKSSGLLSPEALNMFNTVVGY